MVGCYDELLALCRKVESLERQHLIMERTVSAREDDTPSASLVTVRLTVGYGYFTGALCSAEGRDDRGVVIWNRFADRPLEESVKRFLAGEYPKANEPWVEVNNRS
jgi:hypothetical protein